MSSKFGGIPKTQKPPAVCKKAPPPDALPPPPFNDRHWQGWCWWNNTTGSDRVDITENVAMVPVLISGNWLGTTAGTPYALQLDMQRDPAGTTFSWTITLLLNGFAVGTHQKLNVSARSMDPFDSGLIDFIGAGSQQQVRCRIMS